MTVSGREWSLARNRLDLLVRTAVGIRYQTDWNHRWTLIVSIDGLPFVPISAF